MALRTRTGGGSGRGGGLKADRRLYRTASGEPCNRGDTRAAALLAGKGRSIPQEYVERWNMRLKDGRVVWGEPEKAPEPAPEPDPKPVEPEITGPEEPEGPDPEPDPKKLGGGWWELADGRKVRTSDLPDDPEPDDEG